MGHSLTTAGVAQAPEAHGRSPRGVVELVHAGEETRVRVKGAHGQIPSSALDAFERLMRQGATTHPTDPRLVALIGVVSDHFGGKPVEVVSGYRAYTPTQYTPHSNHNYGKALDFRIAGVGDVALYEFCLTLRKVGCGYYPNSTFVHIDARDASAHWVDRSRPGEPPLYDKPGVAADEDRNDVRDEREMPTTAPPVLPPDAHEERHDERHEAPSQGPSERSTSPQPADGEMAL